MSITILLELVGLSIASYQRHNISMCSAIHCHDEHCPGAIWSAASAPLSECLDQCSKERCSCLQWRDPAAHHPSPLQPSCLTTNISTAVSTSVYGYTAWVNTDAPGPTPGPGRHVHYTTRGAIEVGII